MSQPVLMLDRDGAVARPGQDVSETLGRLFDAASVGATIDVGRGVFVVAEAADITPALTAWMTGGAT